MVLGLGTHSITLVVNDGGATGTATITVEVIAVDEAIDEIIALLESADLGRNRDSLIALLEAAADSFDRGNTRVGCLQLQALLNTVGPKVGRTNPALAQDLGSAVEGVRQAVCPP